MCCKICVCKARCQLFKPDAMLAACTQAFKPKLQFSSQHPMFEVPNCRPKSDVFQVSPACSFPVAAFLCSASSPGMGSFPGCDSAPVAGRREQSATCSLSRDICTCRGCVAGWMAGDAGNKFGADVGGGFFNTQSSPFKSHNFNPATLRFVAQWYCSLQPL
jgi:hypothetical protein